ncbi:hypothetical protein IWW50_005437 [Coemansia erecta]|nr:hypothetical protein GGF43_003043 [Coemansia sp. RSA 2618]KAJ2819500.1 hypothetical protein IWW50_005437 [Coemansia erecta]
MHEQTRAGIRAMLAQTMEMLQQQGRSEDIERVVTRYTECLRVIAAADSAAREEEEEGGADGQGGREVREIGAMLADIGRRVARVVVRAVRRDPGPPSTRMLVWILGADHTYDPAYMLSTHVVRQLGQCLQPRDAEHIFAELLARVRSGFDRLSEQFIEAVFATLYRSRGFGQVAAWERCLLRCRRVSSDTAFTVLRAIRREQASDAALSVRTSMSARECRRGRPLRIEVDLQSEHCQRARRIVWLLAQRSAGAVNAGHLTQLLVVELAAIPRGRVLPAADTWLARFARFGVAPSAHTYAAIIHAYFARGDAQTAWQLFQRMARRADPLLPAPDRSTVPVLAKLWASRVRASELPRMLGEIQGARGRVTPQLATYAMSRCVDARDLEAAEALWTGFACRCASGRAGNYRALAKLVLGYARLGHVEKAMSFFHTLCQERGARRCLPGVFSAVLRSAIAHEPPSAITHEPPCTLRRRDLQLIDLARTYGIPMTVTTYNVLFAGLSRSARHIPGDDHTGRREVVARVMHSLYVRMVDEERVCLDDTTLAHLVPMWMYMGHADVALMRWRGCVRGRPPSTVGQLERHVLVLAGNWNVVDKTRALLDSVKL